MHLKKTFIYKYQEDTETPLCIYLCDTQAKNKILIVPLVPNAATDTISLTGLRQHADIKKYKEIDSDQIISPLYLKSKHVKVSNNDLTKIWQNILSDMFEKIEADTSPVTRRTDIFEQVFQFLKWKHQKLLLNIQPYIHKTTVYENGIYWASLGVNVGSELNKSRPVLIWKKRCNGSNEASYSYIVIPITSKEKCHNYYMNVPIDINGKTCYARIEDMKRINIKRITRPILNSSKQIIFIDTSKREEIKEAIKRFYLFDNKYTKID